MCRSSRFYPDHTLYEIISRRSPFPSDAAFLKHYPTFQAVYQTILENIPDFFNQTSVRSMYGTRECFIPYVITRSRRLIVFVARTQTSKKRSISDREARDECWKGKIRTLISDTKAEARFRKHTHPIHTVPEDELLSTNPLFLHVSYVTKSLEEGKWLPFAAFDVDNDENRFPM